jgi:hypothetical protein
MKKFLMIALGLGAAVAAAAPASASGGCGPGGHRNRFGECRPNRGPVIVVPRRPIVGTYYHGRGYWDGHRYWRHRDRWHGDWRYR